MAKLEVECVGFRPLLKNTLRGFASVRIPAMCLTIHDVAVHQKNASRWVQLPGKPQIDRSGNPIRDQSTGKPKYSQVLEWDNDLVRKAFAERACAAIAESEPDAFAELEAAEDAFR